MLALLLVVAMPIGVAAVVASTADDEPDRPALTAAQLEAYQEAVHPALSDGGKVVEQGMKPAVATLRSGGAGVRPLASSARTWVRDLREVRDRVAAVPPPDDLAAASAGFDRALALYVEAAEALGRAARAPAAQRQGIVDDAVETARKADAAYDDASRVLQDWRRRLGLGATSQFPDPSPSAA